MVELDTAWVSLTNSEGEFIDFLSSLEGGKTSQCNSIFKVSALSFVSRHEAVARLIRQVH